MEIDHTRNRIYHRNYKDYEPALLNYEINRGFFGNLCLVFLLVLLLFNLKETTLNSGWAGDLHNLLGSDSEAIFLAPVGLSQLDFDHQAGFPAACARRRE